MAEPKLCSTCRDKKPDYNLRGTCQAGSQVTQQQLPADHDPWTRSINFTLCDACAEHFDFCAWCWGPLDGHSPVTVPTEKRFCRVFADDNGKHIEGMYVGEQILAQFNIDRFSGTSWRVKDTSYGVRQVASRLVTDGGPWGRMGTLELYFDLDKLDAKAYIELEEYAQRSWLSLARPNTWKITIEVTQ